jgi:AraC-like DNA-binding protein
MRREGRRPVEVAVAAGCYDQSHVIRHFRRVLGTSPSRFAGASTTWSVRTATKSKEVVRRPVPRTPARSGSR